MVRALVGDSTMTRVDMKFVKNLRHIYVSATSYHLLTPSVTTRPPQERSLGAVLASSAENILSSDFSCRSIPFLRGGEN